MSTIDLAQKVMERIETLARISEESDRLIRTFGSPAMRKANDLVGSWMQEAGMTISEDAIGNLIGRYPGSEDWSKKVIIGSHLDTVRDAGKFDGALGVLAGIACVQQLHQSQTRLPFAIEVVGFADEEGARYQTTYLGSKVMAGRFNPQDLKRVDARGISLADAIRAYGGNPDKLKESQRDPNELLGYVELHLEQGPILEKRYQPVGVVTAIAGQTRTKVHFTGQAGHAGTTPLNLRHDALVAAAHFIVAVEAAMRDHPGLMATVGQVEVRPGSSNVIPGDVLLTLDVRHQLDASRTAACSRLQETAHRNGEQNGIIVDWEVVHETQSVPCSRELSAPLAKAARRHLVEVTELASGAGHDAAVMGEVMPMTMLFVRCKGGISHHPDELVHADDVRISVAVLSDFLLLLGNQLNPLSNRKHAST